MYTLLRRIHIKYRMAVIVALGIAGCSLIVSLAVGHAKQQYIRLEKKNAQQLVESAIRLAAHYHASAERGERGEIEAKRAALDALQTLGPNDATYVYVYHDLNFMVMHPKLPQQSLSDLTPDDIRRSLATSDAQLEQHRIDYNLAKRRATPMEILQKHHPEEKRGFFEYFYIVDDNGLGFMAEAGDPQIPEGAPPKLGYGSRFEPWQWTILTGVNLGDLDRAIDRSLQRLLPIFAAVITLLTLASWIISRSITKPLAGGMHRLNSRLLERRFDDIRKVPGDEVERLNVGFDLLMEQLDERDAALRRRSEELTATNRELMQHKQNLEEEVAARTRDYKTAKEAAERATAAKSNFIATMTHELRTPMSGVLGIVDLLKETPLDSKQRQFVDIISRSGQQLLGIVGDILNYEKLAADKLELEQVAFDLKAELGEVVAPFQMRTDRDTALDISLDYAADCPRNIIGDPLRIRQVVNNFLSNAYKFTEAGSITVIVKRIDERLHVAVRDTGIGLSAEQQALIFADYQQADSSTARKYGGTGLGLAISKRLIELMGGAINVKSEPGAGAIFYFEIPLQEASNQHSENIAHPSGVASPDHFALLRVLVAEDNSVNQMVIKGYLDKFGIAAAVVPNGQDALRYATTEDFNLVLMDVNMPELDGLQATRLIRRHEAQSPKTPMLIVALTADASDSSRQQCLEAGMDDVLTKPIRLEALIAVLNHALARATDKVPSTILDGTDIPANRKTSQKSL